MSGFAGLSNFGLGAITSTALNAPELLIFGADPIILDNFMLSDFQIPEKMNWGGTQHIAAHQLVGGERVFDIMGREEEPIAWSGVLLGSQAIQGAISLDVLRAQGRLVQLNWGTLSYSVVVETFTAEYEHRFHIPYRISCKVLRDNAAPLPNDSITAAQASANDISSANNALPDDTGGSLKTVTKAETGRGTTVTKTYEQVVPRATQQANPAGNTEIDPFVKMVDLGPPAPEVPIAEVPIAEVPGTSVVQQGGNIFNAYTNAGTAAETQAITDANAPLFTGQ